MKTKILYVLVSNASDIFWEQTFVSITSLRNTNQNAVVSVLMDDTTSDGLVGIRKKIKELVDEIIVISLDKSFSNKKKSRVLKTNMRNYVEGDFLYIDSDTIILEDLNEIDNVQMDIGAVYERNRPRKYDIGRFSSEEALKRFGCYISDTDEYYNSGVMYVKDNYKTRQFFRDWFKEWEKGVGLNIYYDQPALGVVNLKYNNYIKPLDGSWNCQGRYCLNYIKEAKIFHYLYDIDFIFPLMNKSAFSELKETGIINEQLQEIIVKPFRHISCINEIIMAEDVKRYHTRYFSLIRIFNKRLPRVYNCIECLISKLYKFVLSLKTRTLTPPR